MTKPLYQQIAEQILAKIKQGDLQPGDRLPSEHALSKQFSAGRNTIRHALSELSSEGYVETVHGVGTFVSKKHTPKTAEFLYGFSQEMALRGKQVSSEVLEAQLIAADPYLTRRLQIQLGDEVVFLYRLRYLEGEPTAIERAYLPHVHCPGILEFDFSHQSLYDVLAEDYQIQLDHAEQEIGAELATGAVSEMLHLDQPAVVLVIRRETHTTQGQVIEYVESEFRADRFRFYTRLKSSGVSEVSIFQRFPVNTKRD